MHLVFLGKKNEKFDFQIVIIDIKEPVSKTVGGVKQRSFYRFMLFMSR